MDSLSYYRDTLGFEEAWRRGDQAIALQLLGTDVQLLIENDEHDLGAGGVFRVNSVDEFFEEKKDSLSFVKETMKKVIWSSLSLPELKYSITPI